MKKKLFISIIGTIILLVIISLITRFTVFICQDRIFGEWTSLMDELSEGKPQERHPFPHDYYMHSAFEVYAVKQFRFHDDTGKLTEKQIRECFQPLVDASNLHFDGNETMIYVGHDDPYNITPKYFLAKPLYLFSNSDRVDENYWHVIIYKRARNPFML
ncbi:MAG: hypothetical protein IJW06_01320 [Clostridia bacterium]|nr:hypothetical protein [Clostridia bacterium]